MVPRSAATILSALGLVLAATMPVAAQSQDQNQGQSNDQEQTTLEKIGIGGDLRPYFSLFGGGVFAQEASLEGENSLDGDLSCTYRRCVPLVPVNWIWRARICAPRASSRSVRSRRVPCP